MAVYTHVDGEALASLLSRYDIGRATLFEGIQSGVENTNYRLYTDRGRYILTLYERRVDPADLPYFLDVMAHLGDHGLPVPDPVCTREGEALTDACGRPAAILTFLNGRSDMSPSPDCARTAGAMLARMHLAARDFAQDRRNALGPDAWLPMAQHLGSRLDEIDTGLERELTGAAEDLLRAWPKDLPRGAIHADFFPDNVLFDDGEVAGVIDFYFACTDAFAYDLAIAMNAFVDEARPDPQVAVALRQGYETVRPLSAREVEALPTLLSGSALRFALTRAHDVLHQVPGSLVTVKDPMPWVALLRGHKQTPSLFSEGVR